VETPATALVPIGPLMSEIHMIVALIALKKERY